MSVLAASVRGWPWLHGCPGIRVSGQLKTCVMLLGERGNRAWLPESILRWGQSRKRAEGTTFITSLELSGAR